MLNPFPIQFLSMLAYTILRVCVGAILIHLGIKHNVRRHDIKHSLPLPNFSVFVALTLSLVELVTGVMLIAGYYTQYAALAVMGMSAVILLFYRQFASPLIPNKTFYLLLFGAALSLFITGAGAFAFDLPI